MGASLGLLFFLAPSAVETFIFASGRGAADIGLIRLFPTSKKLAVAFHLSILILTLFLISALVEEDRLLSIPGTTVGAGFTVPERTSAADLYC